MTLGRRPTARSTIFAGTCLALLNLALPAAAQDRTADAKAESSPGGATVGEVVVTSDKRPERLLQVPYAVTPVSEQEVIARGALDIKDLQFSIPSLAINPAGPGEDRITLRGINAGTGTGQPVVSVYVDEVGVSIDQQQRDSSFPLVDIDRIEVLRGPQGTLYGQGAVAGAIRYITHDPNLDHVDGFVEGAVYDQTDGGVGWHINGATSLPIVKDVLGLRLTAGYDDRAGWVDYPNAGVNNANTDRTWFIRAKLLWQPTKDLKVTLLYQHYDLRAPTDDFSYGTSATTFPGTYLSPYFDRSETAGLTIDYATRWGTLTSATGYLYKDFEYTFPWPYPAGIGEESKYSQFTEELRFASAPMGPISYVVGAWYRDFRAPSQFFAPGAFSFLDFTGTDPADTRAVAGFADATYQFAKGWDFSAGLRGYEDWRRSDTTTAAGRTVQTAGFDAISPRFNLQRTWTDDITSYVQVAKGFRSGGFNGINAPVPTYGPETLWSFEFGTKAKLFEDHLFVDAAVYYQDYLNRQESSVAYVGGVGITVTENGGRARGPGVELGLTSRLPLHLQLGLSAAYNDVKYQSLTLATVPGERFAFVPDFTGSISLEQDVPLRASATGFWRLDYQYSDGSSAIFRGLGPANAVIIEGQGSTPAYGVLNGRVGVTFGMTRLTFDVTNLANVTVPIYPFVAGVGPLAVHERPRSFGFTVRQDFR